MHLLLTDRLSCARCGPEFGLILLADQMRDRRVLEGVLGCPNCRDRYPIAGGFGDLRAPPRRELPRGLAGAPGERLSEEGERLPALLGLTQGPGTLLLVGGPAAHGAIVGSLLDDVQVVGLDADLVAWPEEPEWSRIVGGPGLPFFSRTLRGVVADGRLGRTWIEEAARVAAPKSRVVIVQAPPAAPGWLRDTGLEIMAEEPGTVVAARG